MKFDENQSLDRTLESAIVVSWKDLLRGAQSGLIHVEYGFASTGTLDYLKVLSSPTRGHWLVACEYWMSASVVHAAGVRFENGFTSEKLAHILEFVMQHQDSFVLPPARHRDGLLQIPTPTMEEDTAAAAMINKVLGGFALPLAVA